MTAHMPLHDFLPDSTTSVAPVHKGDQVGITTAGHEQSKSQPASPSAWCTTLFFALFALIVAAAIAASSTWHNPLLIIFIVALTVWSRSHSVKVTSSESPEDSHAFSLNGVCILALAALNGPLPALIAASASELAPFISPRFHYAGRRSTISDLACNLASAGAFALVGGLLLTATGDALGHNVSFLLMVFVVSIAADFISLLLVAANNYLSYRQSTVPDLVRYLASWRTLFPALALSTGVLVITLWVDRTSGPAAFSFAVLALVSIQTLLGRISRVEFALRQERDKVSWLAHHDGLTGLWNRFALDDELATLTSPSSQNQAVVLLIDLDDFKQINDTLGHVAGDELLRAVADRLVGSLREHDRVFRHGGDEFLVVARIEGEDDAAQVVERAKLIFESPFRLGDAVMTVTGSLGVAEWPREADTGEALLHLADSRMYRHKAAISSPARGGARPPEQRAPKLEQQTPTLSRYGRVAPL